MRIIALVLTVLLTGCASNATKIVNLVALYDNNKIVIENIKAVGMTNENKAIVVTALNNLNKSKVKVNEYLTDPLSAGNINLALEYAYAKVDYLTIKRVLEEEWSNVPANLKYELEALDTLLTEYDKDIEEVLTKSNLNEYVNATGQIFGMLIKYGVVTL